MLHWRKNGDNTPYLSTAPNIRTVKKPFVARLDGPLLFALNAIDYANYKGYFDLTVDVPEN